MIKNIIHSLFCFLILFLSLNNFAQNPGDHWLQYATPEEAGWSSEKLGQAKVFADSVGSAAFMLIYNGKVVTSWGEVERRFMCHSVRKSFLSALYGIYVDKGIIDLSTTLEELNIEDIHHLSDTEKKATIRNLLQARSGIYHPAAYETEAMKRARPERESHLPGTFWYYNNWDFNTSCHILMKHSKKDFFRDFEEQIADPLQLQDFRLEDCYYHLEAEHSQFPAYPFRLSARDMARIGQLFLQMGQWDGRRIVSENWVRESAMTSYSENTRAEGRGYSYMWWTGIYGSEHRNFSAQGVGNQAIIVYPDDNIVMVNRANTFLGESVSTQNLIALTKMIMEARNDDANSQPSLFKLPDYLDRYTGEYHLEDNDLTIIKVNGKLKVNIPGQGGFYLIPAGTNRFMLEDAHFLLQFEEDEHGMINKELKRPQN